MQVAKSLGRKPKELENAPRLRSELRYLWSTFVEIKKATSGSITFPEINAYMQIYGNLNTFEVDVICHLDGLHSKENNNHG